MAFIFQRALVAAAFSAGCLAAASPAVASAQTDVAVVEVDPATYTVGSWEARAAAAKSFFATHRDAYDFLVFFPAFPIDLSTQSEAELLGLHRRVRNDVSGIGEPAYDAGALFGSGARLKGVIDVHSLVPGMVQDSGEAALATLAHEVAHQWSAGVSFRDPSSGALSTKLLGPDGAHWSYSLSSDASVMYGSKWTAQPNGTFVATESRKRYSPLDLYLMGILGADEVPPFTLIEPSPGASVPANGLPPSDGTRLTGVGRTISVGDVIAAEGARVPTAASSQKLFRAAFVILTPAGQAPTATQLSFVDGVRREWVNQYFFMTRGRGLMETDLVDAPPGAVAESPSTAAALDWLLASQLSDGAWLDDLATRTRETQAALEALRLFGSDPRVPVALQRGAASLPAARLDTDTWARSMLAERAAGATPASVTRPQPNKDGGYGLAPGYGSTVMDTLLVGLAGAGASSPEVTAYLLRAQNGDGGWPWIEGGPSRVEATAWALQVLAPEQDDPLIRFTGEAGLAFLEGSVGWDGQYTDDGFTSSGVTAEALLALDAWGVTPARSTVEALLAVQAPDGSWDESVLQTARVLRALRRFTTPNLLVTAEEVALTPAMAIDGEPARARIVVHNVGRVTARNVVVRVTDSNGVPLAPDRILASVPDGSSAVVDVGLDTASHAGSERLFVLVDPDGSIDQTTREDDRTSVPFPVRPRPPTAELFVASASLALAPPALSRLPGAFSATALVGNLGLAPASGVSVVLEAGGVVVASTVVDLPPGATQAVTIAATIQAATGPVPVAVRIDPANVIAEEREDNNVAAGSLGLMPTVDVALARLTVPSGVVEQGRDVEIGYTLHNFGTVAANGVTVRVSIRDAADALVAQLTPVVHAVGSGGDVPATIRWRSDRAGTLFAVAAARHPDDVEFANDEARAAFSVQRSTTPNLVVDGGVVLDPNPPLVSHEAEIRFTIANVGGGDAGPSRADVAVGKPGAPEPLASVAVPALVAGERVTLSTQWTPTRSGVQSVSVLADAASEVTEYDEGDNAAARTVEPKPIADLVLTEGDIVPSNPAPRPGQVVYVTVSAYNAGGQPIGATALELFLGDPEAGGTRIGGASLGAIAAGARGSATFRWDTSGVRGTQHLFARVNADRSEPEQSYDNDSASRSVTVQDGAVAVTESYFSPNGDGVKDTTEISYRLAAAAAVEARIANPDGRIVRTLEAPAAAVGSLVWDGRTDTGTLARDDDYVIALVALTPQGAAEQGTARVVLDTNRITLADVRDPSLLRLSPLHEQFGSGYEDDAFVVGVTRDEQAVIMAADSSLGCGIFRVPLAGGKPPELLPTAWPPDPANVPNASCTRSIHSHSPTAAYSGQNQWALSSDDEWVVFSADYASQAPYFTSLVGANLRTGELRELIRSENYLDFIYTQQTPDGRFWTAMEEYSQTSYWPDYWVPKPYPVNFTAAASIQSVDLNGSVRTEVEHLQNDILGFQLSPDGTKVAMLLFEGIPFNYTYRLVVYDVATQVETTLLEFFSLSHGVPHPLRWTADGGRIVLQPAERGYPYVMDGPDFGELVILDAATGAVTIQPRPDGEAKRFALGAVSDVVLFANDGSPLNDGLYVATPIGSSPRRLPFELPALAEGWVTMGGLSRAETVAWFYEASDYREYDALPDAIHNLGNGAAVIRGSRPVGGTAIRFDGIATDAHFESYVVAARPYRAAEPPVVVRRGLAPVMDAELASWVPPGPGLYEAILTVLDKAGNAVQASTVVGWSTTPAIASVTVEPQVFSPNGDGRSDLTSVAYTVVLPGETEFRVTDARGNVVRHLPRIDVAPGRTGFVWDGRNDAGVVVGDGTYRIEGHGIGQLVEVDATAPNMELAADERFLSLSTSLPHWWHPDATLVPWLEEAIAPDATTVYLHSEAGLLSWHAEDRNLEGYEVEIALAGSLAFAPLLASPEQSDEEVLARDLRGASFRGVARDIAGNVTYTEPVSFEEKLLLTGIGDAVAFDPLASGLLAYDGQLLPRYDLLDGVQSFAYRPGANDPRFTYPPMFPAELPFEPKVYALAFVVTTRLPIVSYSVRYRSPIDGAVVEDTANVQMVAEDAILWDATGLPRRSFEAEFVATDANGSRFTMKVPFRADAELTHCVAVEQREDGSIQERLAVAAKVFTSDPASDRLAPGTVLRLTRHGEATPELEYAPAFEASPDVKPDGSLSYLFEFDTDGLIGCEYRLELLGVTPAGQQVIGRQDVQFCGLLAEGPIVVDGARVRLRAIETFRGPFSRIDWQAISRAEQGVDKRGSWPAFEGTTELVFDWPGECPGPNLELETVFPPGAAPSRDVPFRSCPRAGGGEPACVYVSLSLTDVGTMAPRCTPNAREYSVRANIRATAPWVLHGTETWLESGGRGKVASVPLQGNTNTSTTIGTAAFSTAELPEDVLTFQAKVIFRNPSTKQVITASGSAKTPVVVDHTPPATSIRSPADGQHVCSVPVVQADGTTRKVIPFEIASSDDWLGNVNLWTRPVGGQWSAHPLGLSAANPDSCEAGGPGLTGFSYVDASALPPGAYDLFVDAQDCSFGSYCTPPRRFHVDEHATFQTAAASPPLASPDGDGTLDVVRILWTATGSGRLTASDVAADGRRTALFQQEVAAGSGEVPWDGSAQGERLADGRHRIALDLEDTCGGKDARFVEVTLDTVGPEVRIRAPAQGAVVGATIAVTGDVFDANLASWTLTIAPAGIPEAVQSLAAGTQQVAGVLGAFSTAGLSPGDHLLTLAALDAAGHRSEDAVPVRIVPRQILAGFSAMPPLISPNDDGILDAATATVELLGPATLDLVALDGAGVVRAVVASAVPADAGVRTFPLDAGLLAPLADGPYVLQVTATAGGQETESAPLVIDRIRPVVSPASPTAGGWIAGALDVTGAISDLHLAEWSVVLRSDAGDRTLATGTADVAGRLATAAGLADGAYRVVLHAADGSGNIEEKELAFSSDATPPTVSVDGPGRDEHVSGRLGPISVEVSVTDVNLAASSIVADTTAGAHTIWTGQESGSRSVSWDVGAEQDGPTMVRISASDLAGNHSESAIPVVVDNTPPVARVESPHDGFLGDYLEILGTASDDNLRDWVLELASGPASLATDWVAVATGAGAVQSTALTTLAARPADGVYALRLTVVDRAGNATEDVTSFVVDTTPPLPPLGLSAVVEGGNRVALSWTASPDPDVVGYRVLRGLSADALSPLPGVVAGTHRLDGPVPDGVWTYAVVAVDRADLESGRSNTAVVEIDATLPRASIAKPTSGDLVRGTLAVLGTAYAPRNFLEYRLEVGVGTSPSDFTIVARSPSAVAYGPLGEFDTSTFPEGSQLTVRVLAEDVRGRTAEARVAVTVDNVPPAAPVLLSVVRSGSDARLTWRASPEPDLAGYLVLRNGVTAKAPEGTSLDDLTRYLAAATSTAYTDPALQDGSYIYQLQAMDRAGNLSALSNAITLSVDTRRPSAMITAPANLARLPGPATLVAEVPDRDVASVRFEARARSDAPFVTIAPPVTSYPFVAQLDPFLAPEGVVEVRAVATDVAGNEDLSPRSAYYFFDVQPEPPSVRTLADGTEVTVSWTDTSLPGELAGYRVTRIGFTPAAEPRPSGVASASSSAAGKPPAYAYDGSYGTTWTAAVRGVQRWQVDLAVPVMLDAVRAELQGRRVDVSVKVRGLWVKIAQQVSQSPLKVEPPLMVEAVAIDSTDPYATFSLSEVSLDAAPLVAGSPWIDPAGSSSYPDYSVVATTSFGLTATGAASSHVFSASAYPSAYLVRVPQVSVSGYTAGGADAHVYSGAVDLVTAPASSLGTFSLVVPLELGPNVLSVRGIDADGNRSTPSSPFTVTYEPLPAVDVVLELASIEQSDATLAFSATGDVDRVSSWVVTRDDFGWATTIATLPSSERTFVDLSLANGRHVYTVVPLFSNDQGAPSNAVEVFIAVPLPPAPADLRVDVAPEANRLVLSWTYAGPTVPGFAVERAGSAEGPFYTHGSASGLGYDDYSATRGAPTWYRVRAVDAQGNEGPPSNVASGTLPAPILAAPRLLQPTDEHRPITVGDPIITLGGIADPYSSVELMQNGRYLGTVQAGSQQVVRTPLPTRLEANGGFADVSADGNLVAYVHYPPVGDLGTVAVDDLSTGSVRTFAVPDVDLRGQPLLSPDGRRVAVGGVSQLSYRMQLYVGEVATGEIRMLVPDDTRDVDRYAWSPDSGSLAFTVVEGLNTLWVADVAAGTARPVGAESEASVIALAWTRPEAIIVALQPFWSGSYALARVDALSGSRTDLFTGTTLAPVLAVAADGSALAFAGAESGYSHDLWILDLPAEGAPRKVIASDGTSMTSLAFSPDRTRIAAIASDSLVFYDLASGLGDSLGYVGWSTSVLWPTAGPVIVDNDGFGTVDSGGWFELTDVRLDAGRNVFRGYAIDAAGARGAASEPIVVTFDVRQLPDLAPAVVVAPPLSARGTPVNAVVTIHNLGGMGSSPVDLLVRLVSPDGTSRTVATVEVGAIPAGGVVAAPVPLELDGLSGEQTVVATVDPGQQGSDADRSNDSATATFTVAGEGITLGLNASPREAQVDDVVTAQVALLNGGPPVDVTLRVRVTDAAGEVAVEGLPAANFAPLATGQSVSVEREMPVGATLAGEYTVLAEVTDGSAVVATRSAPLTIVADRAASLRLAATRAEYLPTEPIALTSFVTNASRNAPLEGALLGIEVRDAAGSVAWTGDAQPLQMIWLGGEVVRATAIPAGLLAAGAYSVHGVVELDGTTIAVAQTSFSIAAQPLLAGGIAVDAPGSPPAVKRGVPLPATATVRNVGTGPALGVVARVAVVDGQGAVVASYEVDLGDLQPGASGGVAAVVPTEALPLGVYGLALTSTLGGVTESLATARFRVADGLAPTLAFLNLSEGILVRESVMVRVQANDDATGVAAVTAAAAGVAAPLAMESGNPISGVWSGVVALPTDGPHLLRVSARDAEGNDGALTPGLLNPISVTVVRDTVPPEVSVTGVAEGALVNHPVLPVVTATDLHLAGVETWLDGGSFSQGTSVGTDGDHLVRASAFDHAGNSRNAALSFTIDQTPPSIAVLGVGAGSYSANDVTPRVVVEDLHLEGYTATVDGMPIVEGAVLSDERAYQVAVEARDLAGNYSSGSLTFTIDKTAPVIQVAGVSEGQWFREAARPDVIFTDANLLATEVTLDGVSFLPGTLVAAEGEHVLVAKAVDKAGNRAEQTVRFSIDASPPSIAILGVVDGAFASTDVAPRIVVDDLHLEGYTATLDGAPFVDGSVLSAERAYLLAVEAKDLAGNLSGKQITFTIDKTAPIVQVSGVSEGQWFRGAAIPDVSFTDANLATTKITLNGATFLPGNSVSAEGEHVLFAEAVDKAGNRAEQTVRFFIDLTAPVIEIAGVSNGDLVNHAVTPVVTVTDANLDSSETKLEGVISLPGASVGGDGEHVVEVSASDLAGNSASARVVFEIDTVAPVIWASVQSGATYPAPLTVSFSAEDLHYGDVTATMDGQPFTSGEVVVSAGAHALAVTARDLAGNEVAERFEFTIADDQELRLTKELMGRSGNVLAWVSDGCRTHSVETDRVRAFIRRSAPAGSIVHFAPDDADFRTHLRGGEFGVYVVATVSGAAAAERGDDEGDQHGCTESEHEDEHADGCESDDRDGHHDHDEGSRDGDRASHADVRAGGDDDRDRHADDGHEEGHDNDEDGEHEHDCASGCRSLSRLTERELTEAVFRGAGLVVLKSGPNEVPALREASGVHVQGQEQEELVRLIESAFTQPGLLAIGGGVELELEGGAPVGWFGETGDEVAVSANQFGLGEALVFGFDLAAALPAEVASETFARAIGFAAGESELLPAGVVGVRIRVENSGSVTGYRLVETVAPELRVARVLDGGQHGASGAIEWTGEVAASEADSLRYFVRLPVTPGAFDTKTQLFLTTGASERLVAETSLPLVLAGSRASLEGSAEAAIGRLPTTGPDGAVRRQLASALDELKMNMGSTAEAREEAIETLLDAADLAMKLRTVDPTPLRVAIDRLLAYWEMKP